jgi:hypothetical protein
MNNIHQKGKNIDFQQFVVKKMSEFKSQKI